MRQLLLTVLLLLAPAAAQGAACPDYLDRVAAIAEAQAARQPLAGLAPLPDAATAACVRDHLIDTYWRELKWGRPVGYKVALTSEAMRQRLGIAQPLWGALLAGMLLPDGASVPLAYGARPIAEADLLVSVADEAINEATTLAEVAAGLGELRAFIELADLVLAEGEPISAETLVAINVGARLGVVGPALPMTAELAAALPGMSVTLAYGGEIVMEAPGAAILGHPLEAVLFLTAALKAEGRRLKTGDVISLGSFGPPAAPRAGQTLTATYQGLPGGPLSVRVTFESE